MDKPLQYLKKWSHTLLYDLGLHHFQVFSSSFNSIAQQKTEVNRDFCHFLVKESAVYLFEQVTAEGHVKLTNICPKCV